jgi:hypothetical protein
MKVMFRLAILVAALLLVTNIAFAAPICDEHVCYNVLFTAENGSSHTEGWDVCLNHDGTGTLNTVTPLALFGDGPIWCGFDAHPKWTKWIMHSPAISGEISTDIFGVSLWGEGYITAANSRFIVQGLKRVPCL